LTVTSQNSVLWKSSNTLTGTGNARMVVDRVGFLQHS
jgi:hypothetical protein